MAELLGISSNLNGVLQANLSPSREASMVGGFDNDRGPLLFIRGGNG